MKSAERARWREQQESLIREGSDPAMEDKGLSPDEPFSNFVVISDYFTASVWPAQVQFSFLLARYNMQTSIHWSPAFQITRKRKTQ